MIMQHLVSFPFHLLLLISVFFLVFPHFSMKTLTVGSLNINGGRDKHKMALISEVIRQKSLDVVFLQETHSTIDNEVDWNLWWKGFKSFSHGSNLSSGVAVLFSTNLSVNILSTTELVKGRALLVRVDIDGLIYSLVNIYASNLGSERVSLCNQLRTGMHLHNQDYIIMGGDWNCTIDFTLDRIGDEPHVLSGISLRKMLQHLDLVDAWRVKYSTEKQYTWFKASDNSVSAARLDRFYISHNVRLRLVSSVISPVGFSDHHLVTIQIHTSPAKRVKSHWHFNNKLLQDITFCQSLVNLWTQWRCRKTDFDSLSQWWEVGKTQIRVFCQQYTSHSTGRIKKIIQDLEKEITQIEGSFQGRCDSEIKDLLQGKRRELSSFLQERVKGALVRSRFISINEMDAPTSFFFNLERTVVGNKQMTCLELPGGGVTTDPVLMRSHAINFYTNLFGAEHCDDACVVELLEELPCLSSAEKESLDTELSYEELTAAMGQLNSGRAPGIDGLTTDFFKCFWEWIGPDFYEVIKACYIDGCLPVSCRRAVLSLLPKQGDLALLKNWRPVALLCTDYKVLSRALSNRLKDYLEILVHMDQSYCVPERCIFDNLFLIRDVLDLSTFTGLNFGILSLDQEKAFDRVDHGYLFSALKAYGLGDSFIKWIKLLYSEASCMVKVGGGLSRPIPIFKGIRQGCPISGQLYSLAIEPLLCRLRARFTGISLHKDSLFPLVVSAYADDINIFIKDQKDVQKVIQSLDLYEKASCAKVNWAKCKALQVGQWEGDRRPSLPGGLEWGVNGLKVLGVFLGTSAFREKNWEGLIEKVCAKLSKWKWLLPQLSYRGRVLVINNLVASTLWHRLAVLPPPRGLIDHIQRTLIDFFWSGKHWIRAAALDSPVQEGGQGLIDVSARVLAFRLKAVQRLLYHQGLRWQETAQSILQRLGRFGYGKHLFLLRTSEIDGDGLTPFYSSLVQAWQVLKVERDPNARPGPWLMEEPLFFNDLIKSETLSSVTVRTTLREAGCVKLGHLLKCIKPNRDILGPMTNIRSSRLRQRIVAEVLTSLPETLRGYLKNNNVVDQWIDDGGYIFPSFTVVSAVEDWEEEEDLLLTFTSPQLGVFEEMTKKAAYIVCVKVSHFRSLTGVKVSRWAEFFGPGKSPKGCWRSLYKLPLDKRTADLQWRVVHGAVATNRYIAHLDPGQDDGCPFCSQTETVGHLFISCLRLKGLFELVRVWFQGLGEAFSFELFIFGPRYSAKKKGVHTLINFLSGVAKLSVWISRKNRIKGSGSIDPEKMFKGFVAARLRVEHTFYETTGQMEEFEHKWALAGVLCTVGLCGDLVLSF